MSKRARTESLTGGTGDVNPQWLSNFVTQSAADTTTTTEIALPIQRIASNAPNTAVVMEILRILVDMPTITVALAPGEATVQIQLAVSTISFGTTATNFADPRVIAMMTKNMRGAFTAGGSYATMTENGPLEQNLTDAAGHGVLVATDNIFFQASSTGTGLANRFNFKVLYRWKRISLAEYIGIVQSQQG